MLRIIDFVSRIIEISTVVGVFLCTKTCMALINYYSLQSYLLSIENVIYILEMTVINILCLSLIFFFYDIVC